MASITIYLDSRRKKGKDKYPVKLRVYHQYETRLYPVGVAVSEEEFAQSYGAAKPRTEHLRVLKAKIAAVEAKANEAADELRVFSFAAFERRLLRPTGSRGDALYYYEQMVARLKREERVSSASSYHLSQKSLQRFLESKGRKSTHLTFEHITVEFLDEYEKWMLREGNARTTVGIYLRSLRALFNLAIAEGDIPRELYPFGKRRYQIPASRNLKKALSREELKRLLEHTEGVDAYMERARAFWFFSYVCNGMNMRDIAELQLRQVHGDTLSFVRSKTKNTSKHNQKTILVVLTPYARQVLEQYGTGTSEPNAYLFPILEAGLPEAEKVRRIQAFTRYVNQHVKRLAKLAGLPPAISTYWARHSFTTMAVQNGASLEFIQDSLGHSSIATTMKYWKGFEQGVKKEMANKLMDFK